MPQSTLTTAANTLKVVYTTPRMYKAFKHLQPVTALLGIKPQAVTQGYEFKINVHTGGSSAGAAVAENGDDPAPDPQANEWLTFNMTTYERTVRLTGQLIESTKTTEAAVKEALAFEVSGSLRDARTDLGIWAYTPASGALTKCRRGVSTTQFYVANAARLRVGMKIAVAKTSTVPASGCSDYGVGETTGTKGQYTRIINIAPTGLVTVGQTCKGYTDSSAEATLKATPVGNWVTDDYYDSDHSVYDYSAFMAGGAKVFGLEDFVDSANPLGIGSVYYGQANRSTAGNSFNQGHLLDLEGNLLTDDIAEELMTVVETFSGGEIQVWLGDPRIWRELKKTSLPKQATTKVKVANQWFESVTLAGKPFIPDPLCTARTVYGLDTREQALSIRENRAYAWVNMDGSMWRKVASKWAWEALATRMWQLAGIPSSHCRIQNCGYTSFTEETDRMAA